MAKVFLLLVLFFVRLGTSLRVTLTMSSRGGGGPARGPNNPLNSRGGSQKSMKKAQILAEKQALLLKNEKEKELERFEIEARREEDKRIIQARKDADREVKEAARPKP